MWGLETKRERKGFCHVFSREASEGWLFLSDTSYEKRSLSESNHGKEYLRLCPAHGDMSMFIVSTYSNVAPEPTKFKYGAHSANTQSSVSLTSTG